MILISSQFSRTKSAGGLDPWPAPLSPYRRSHAACGGHRRQPVECAIQGKRCHRQGPGDNFDIVDTPRELRRAFGHRSGRKAEAIRAECAFSSPPLDVRLASDSHPESRGARLAALGRRSWPRRRDLQDRGIRSY
jgi:hypothetical protein